MQKGECQKHQSPTDGNQELYTRKEAKSHNENRYDRKREEQEAVKLNG